MPYHAYIITGASSGLGAELSKQLLHEENHVFCLSQSENDDVKGQAAGYRYSYHSIDLSRVDGLNIIMQDIFAKFELNDVESITLINNAASVSPIKDIQYCTQEEIMANIQLNLTTPIMLTSNFIRRTSEWKVNRRIVNISSGSADYPAQGMSLYCSTKSALNMFSHCVGLEQEGRTNEVQIFTIDPGMMNTPMQKIARNSDFELSEFFSKQKSEGNLSDPAHVATKIISIINSPLKKKEDIHRV
ncbi:SDR family NAD(P)-dependent oxidoreductase [Paenibacillus anseongense]|uniref:SDR family NAD(P)-dependent oxidoreductase n=1 Tax=Paenibacillus anseongense TaxID=2682845 RepID=UPI002DBCCD2E|nr:SDR family NAD(P)-dependent oxidoreductase [Paenibacillus anseongense]MEC0270468.1 SDR family NAD(P)-dependent oxidoreductase [Paenibacillus anseongense]